MLKKCCLSLLFVFAVSNADKMTRCSCELWSVKNQCVIPHYLQQTIGLFLFFVFEEEQWIHFIQYENGNKRSRERESRLENEN